jgi:hypothetical protein
VRTARTSCAYSAGATSGAISASLRRGDALAEEISGAIAQGDGHAPALRVAEEAHDEHVLADLDRRGRGQARGDEALEVPHLLLRPQAHHLPRVVAVVAAPEAVLARDVLVPVLEHEDRRLEDLEREVRAVRRERVVHVCLRCV